MDNNKQKKQKNKQNTKEQIKPINIEKYQDPEGITIKKLHFGLWFVEHRRQLLNILTGILIFISVVSWSYTIYGFGYYLLWGMRDDAIMVTQLVNSNIIGHSYVEGKSAKDLIYFTPQVFQSSKQKYDFLVQIKNANKRHWAKFEYYFIVANENLDHGYGYILPDESKYFMSLAHQLSSRPITAQFIIEKVEWNKIDPHVIMDWEAYRNERFDFTINDIKFTPAGTSGLSEKISLNSLEFSATNNSAYSFWDVNFVILLYKRGVIIAANKYTLDEFMSGQTRKILASWPGNIGRVDNVEIMPAVNINDEDIYIRPEGGIGEVK